MRTHAYARVFVLLLAAAYSLRSGALLGGDKAARRIEISVTEEGFSPKRLAVKKGEPVTLVFTRRTDHTCAKDVVIYLDDDKTVSRKLPLNQPVEVAVTFAKSGERGFACSMKMHGGAIMVE